MQRLLIHSRLSTCTGLFLVQVLLLVNEKRYVRFCVCFLHLTMQHPQVMDLMYFANEAWFHSWIHSKSKIFLSLDMSMCNVSGPSVWCAISQTVIIRLVLFDCTVGICVTHIFYAFVNPFGLMNI